MGNYNFVPFPVPKMARFKFREIIKGKDYFRDVLIIGMDGDRYVFRLQDYIISDVNDPDYGKKISLPVSIHESRFKYWITPVYQTSLF